MLNAIKHKILTLFQLLLVISFIIFEEIIWEGIAKPIYTYVHSLKVLQRVELRLQRANPNVILFVFLSMFLLVEVAGIFAGILLMSGNVVIGLTLYISRIPITAFTFWLFRVTEEKLMTFGWFKWLYEKIMSAVDWLKSRQMYIETMVKLKAAKERIKSWYREFKGKYFSEESPFMAKLKELYATLKNMLRSNSKTNETPSETNEPEEPKK